MNIIEVFGIVLMTYGIIAAIIGVIGIYYMPNFYCAFHAASVLDSYAAPIFLIGVAIKFGELFFFLKITFIIICLLITSSTGSYWLARTSIINYFSESDKKNNRPGNKNESID